VTPFKRVIAIKTRHEIVAKIGVEATIVGIRIATGCGTWRRAPSPMMQCSFLRSIIRMIASLVDGSLPSSGKPAGVPIFADARFIRGCIGHLFPTVLTRHES
jgi:hypothetical protein